MSDIEFHSWLVNSEYIFALLTLVILLFISAPYGRHFRQGWGPNMPNYAGWILMEFPTVVLFGLFFSTGQHRHELVPLILLVLWQSHYLYRTFIFPFRMRSSNKSMPVLIALMGCCFNTLNAWINAIWISHLGGYDPTWLSDPRFIIGFTLFLLGFAGNLHSDEILRTLRKPGEDDYKIPNAGLHKLIASPNYLCETIEWFGWALLTWSSAGLAFALYTMANLLPRAIVHHKWYREHFEDYPKERKVFIPYLF